MANLKGVSIWKATVFFTGKDGTDGKNIRLLVGVPDGLDSHKVINSFQEATKQYGEFAYLDDLTLVGVLDG